MTLAEAAAQADGLAQAGSERELAQLRSQWDDELESAARSADYRDRARAVVGAPRRGLELVVPLRPQLSKLTLRPRLRETVGLRRGLAERHETDCSEREAGPM